MAVICVAKLILYNQDAIIRQVTADQVDSETANCVFRRTQFNLNPQRCLERVGIGEQPRSEVMSLVGPDLPWVKLCKP
jgi:hypothetical protein